MDHNLPFSEHSKSFGIGPPPPDIVNPLDRLARRPRLAPHLTPPFPLPFPAPHLSAAHDTMSLNFAPPPRSKINSHNTSTSLQSDKHMKDSNESSLMNEQGECHRLVYMVLCVSHTLSPLHITLYVAVTFLIEHGKLTEFLFFSEDIRKVWDTSFSKLLIFIFFRNL